MYLDLVRLRLRRRHAAKSPRPLLGDRRHSLNAHYIRGLPLLRARPSVVRPRVDNSELAAVALRQVTVRRVLLRHKHLIPRVVDLDEAVAVF